MLLRIVLFLALCVACSGCLRSSAAQFMESAAKYRAAQGSDTRSWCVKNDLSTVYGTDKLRVAVTGEPNVSVSCTDDGLTVKSDAAGVTLPIAVQPQFRLEQPVVAPPR